jgi:hypothetical protein
MRLVVAIVSLLLGLGCSPRVLVVGLDGATWKVLEPLMEAGYLPNLEQVVSQGSRFDLDCVPADPRTACFCPPVWASIATGQPFLKHGMGSFNNWSTQRQVPALWSVLHEHGGRSTLIAYRGTWPPEASQDLVITETGALVAGEQLYDAWPIGDYLGKGLSLLYTKPSDLLERLGVLPSTALPGERQPAWLPFAEDRVSMEALLRIAGLQSQEEPWDRRADLTMVLLHSIDRVEHIAWKTIQSREGAPIDLGALFATADDWDGPVFRPGPFGFGPLAAPYQEVDEWLGELFETIDYDYVVLVSDHGMTALTNGPGLPGAHDPRHPESHVGILSVTGHGVLAGGHLGSASVLDVAPTVAHLLGLPVADDLPGRVLVEAFEPGREVYLPVETVPSWD